MQALLKCLAYASLQYDKTTSGIDVERSVIGDSDEDLGNEEEIDQHSAKRGDLCCPHEDCNRLDIVPKYLSVKELQRHYATRK
jgi:hypothetical protein